MQPQKALVPVPGKILSNMTCPSMYPSLCNRFDHNNHQFSGFDPLPLAEQLSAHTPVLIPYKAPIDWAWWGTFSAFGLFFVVSIRYVAPVLQNRWTWAAGTILTSLVMISGYMFCRIRGVPFTSGGSWIAPGYQNQYGQETQVVAAICKSYPAPRQI
jgi:hypothetical protein